MMLARDQMAPSCTTCCRSIFVANYRLIIWSWVVVLLCGCSISHRAVATVPPVHGFSIKVNVSKTANQNNPVGLDLVMVTDKNLLKELEKITAKDWFEQREQFERDHPQKTTVVSWEWVPGQLAGPIRVRVNRKARGAVLYAKYFTPGDHRAFINLRTPVALSLREEDFEVQPIE